MSKKTYICVSITYYTYQVQPPQSRVDQWVMARKGYSAFSKSSPSDCSGSYPENLLWGGSYSSTEMQLVYSTASADWARQWRSTLHSSKLQNWSLTIISGHLWEGLYLSAQVQLVYSTALADWLKSYWGWHILIDGRIEREGFLN